MKISYAVLLADTLQKAQIAALPPEAQEDPADAFDRAIDLMELSGERSPTIH